MKVKFANTHVDVWKLRKGVVVRHLFSCEDPYFYIENLGNVWDDEMHISVKNDNGEQGFNSSDLEWLEPH